MDYSSRAFQRMQQVVIALLALTVILLVWQQIGMERVLTLSPTSGHAIVLHDDRPKGGASVATMTRDAQRITAQCRMAEKYVWRFCAVEFRLGHDPDGVDLSGYDTVSLDMHYDGPAKRTIRMNAMNFDRLHSRDGDWLSHHMNELEFTVPADGSLQIPMKLLHSPAWWVEVQKIPVHNTGQQLDNVTLLSLTMSKQLGEHRLTIRSIKFRGKWIQKDDLLLILVGLWFACGVSWPLLGALHLRGQLKSREARLAMQSALNQALQLATKELAGQAFSDPLTGALNRQGLRDALLKQWQSAAPLADTGSLVFMDLDHFKHINDTHGHAVGDDVLRSFAAMVQSKIRATDLLVRWGGEEFLIVFPCSSVQQAAQLAEKLRLAAGAQAWPAGLQVSASFGVTALARGEDIGEAIKRADDALYRAKARGRNCVEVAAES